jgi:hypothetical protein
MSNLLEILSYFTLSSILVLRLSPADSSSFVPFIFSLSIIKNIFLYLMELMLKHFTQRIGMRKKIPIFE